MYLKRWKQNLVQVAAETSIKTDKFRVFFSFKILILSCSKTVKALTLLFHIFSFNLSFSLYLCLSSRLNLNPVFLWSFFLNFNFLLFHKQFQGYISRALAQRRFTEVYVLISINFFFLSCLHRAWKIYNNL